MEETAERSDAGVGEEGPYSQGIRAENRGSKGLGLPSGASSLLARVGHSHATRQT